jgi:hypothetical protein
MNALNPYVILGVIGALLVSFIGGGVLGWHEKSIRVPALLEAQQTTDQQACAKVQLVTKEANDDLQKDRDGIAAKLALSLQQPPTYVPVARATHVCASGVKHAGQDAASSDTGISSGWLLSYAAEAETYRSELTVCSDFLAAERTQPK